MHTFRPDIGLEIGEDAAEQLLQRVQRAAAYNRRAQELSAEGRLTALKVRGKSRLERIEELQVFLRRTTDDGSVAGRILRFVSAAILIITSLCLIQVSLAPFGFGLRTWLIAVGAAIPCVWPAHWILDRYGHPTLLATIGILAFCTALIGNMHAAEIRVDLLLREVQSAIMLTTGRDPSIEEGARFYQTAAPHLRAFFMCMTAAIEIVAGMLLWEANRKGGCTVQRSDARRELNVLGHEMERITEEYIALRNGPAIEEARLMRDVHYGLLRGLSRSCIRRFGNFGWVVVVALVAVHTARAQAPMTVIVPDFTRSESVAMSGDGTSELDKNIQAGAAVLRHLPAGEQFSIVAITAKSFSNPLILLSGHIPADPGRLTLINNIDAARMKFANSFMAKAKAVSVNARQSDVIGAVVVASELLHQTNGRRDLIIYSDMRHSVTPIDIERPRLIAVASTIKAVESHGLIPDLRGMNVWIFGVDGDSKDIAYIRTLREFWTAFFSKAGARLRVFSMMREVPDWSTEQ
jgi:hypothetical protein